MRFAHATLALAAWLVMFPATTGCAPYLPRPPLGAHAASSIPAVVPFPPPPAKPDVIVDPSSDYKNPVWIDGQWFWRGGRWAWQPGEWVDLEPNRVYAMPRVVRRADGQLVWFEGTFREGNP